MTTQHAERRDPNPLILPLFGSPETLQMKAWYWKGKDMQSITSANVVLHFTDALSEIWADGYQPYTKTIVFGSWKYANADDGLPLPTLTFKKDEVTTYSESRTFSRIRVRQGDLYDTFLRRLLRQFDKKMISIWWDSIAPFGDYRGPQTPIAELAIGGMNPSRFVAGTEMRLQLLFPATTPCYWDLQMGTTVLVGNIDMNWNNNIQFAFDSKGSIPMVLYDAITKPLRDEMAYTVGLMKGMPQDTNKRIMQYLDFNEPIFEFDCKDGPKLLPLRIGELTIKPSMMYKQISAGKCKMTMRRNDIRGGQNVLLIGIDLIRRFYFSVIYDNWNSPTIQFATRVEGEAPAPPTGPLCESSRSHESITQTFSSYCIIS